MITEAQVSGLLDQAGNSYEECWATLEGWRLGTAADDSGLSFLRLQPTLLAALLKLTEMHHALAAEKGATARRRAIDGPESVRHRIRTIASWQTGIRDAIAIGKTLGDSFAWFFYQREQHRLPAHLARQEVFYLPAGLGGLGELQFLSDIKGVGDLFALHHGVTTFLRLGDISLIDLKSLRVLALAELKTTEATPTKRTIVLHILGTEELKDRPFFRDASLSIKTPESAPSRFSRRLDAQIRAIPKFFGEGQPAGNVFVQQSGRSYKALNDVLARAEPDRIAYARADDGLLLVAFALRSGGMASRLLDNPPTPSESQLADILPPTRDLLEASSTENSLAFDWLQYSARGRPAFLPGITPMFWWPVEPKLLKRVIFREVSVMLVYNPAHFVKKLRGLGFAVSAKGRTYNAQKTLSKGTCEIKNLGYFLRAVQQHLIGEDTAIGIIKGLAEKVEGAGPGVQISARIFQDLLGSPFRPPSGDLN
jgi:hypothetical protein